MVLVLIFLNKDYLLFIYYYYYYFIIIIIVMQQLQLVYAIYN